ncbi:MAG: DUF3416 domain-containing protein [Chloroflexi bacterium]|nr:DUF3416 domain-containing protein [Chloroflexota bacterium]
MVRERLPPRVVIEDVDPEIACGRFPIKRVVGERVVVEANVFADGHDAVSCRLLHRKAGDSWSSISMQPLGNDRWRAAFTVHHLGTYGYSFEGFIDRFLTWQRDLEKRVEGRQDVGVDLQIGAHLLREASQRADGTLRSRLDAAARFVGGSAAVDERLAVALDPSLAEQAARCPDPRLTTRYRQELRVTVDPPRAGFSAWYELFPRSTAPEQGRHGTLQDCRVFLPYVASMGFDVVYLPPIHPIGRTHRKGGNGSPLALPEDPGSPWGIGSDAGGHTSVHPELGTLHDFQELVARARELGLDVALDVAFQCSPDHPWVVEHPEWFRIRPDGSVQYAENPPKKYQDIYPFDFDTEHWEALWHALKDVFHFWISQGVRIFRVDNPHTKPFAFWEWCIRDIKAKDPDVIFLSEAFTRPRVMHRLAQLGFTQSYTYFAWRNTKWEITDYFGTLTQTDVREYFRPHLWPNTPDILPEYLQTGGRPAFMARLVLAATLGSNFGIYGPAFELVENRAREPGTEEYLDSEKYEIKGWAIDSPHSLRELITLVNRIRRENVALHSDRSLTFHDTDNDAMVCYSKRSPDGENVILVIVVLDPHHRHSAWTQLDLSALDLDQRQPFQVHDLLTDARFVWSGARNYVELDPASVPAHVFRIERRVQSKPDFETDA